MMDHREIEERGIVQLYLEGRLNGDDEERFEEHYLDCPRCLADLEATGSLERGLKAVAAQESVRQTAQQVTLLAAAARLLRSPGLWAAILVAAAGLVFGLVQSQRVATLEGALAEARAAGSSHAGQPPDRGPSPVEESLRADLAAVRQELDEAESRHADERLQDAEQRQRLEGRLKSLSNPTVGGLLAFLSPVRSDDPAAAPATVLRFDDANAEAVLVLDLAAASGSRTRVTVSSVGSADAVWRSEWLPVGAEGELTLRLPPGFLSPGDYRIRVEETRADGTEAPPRLFPIRVETAPPG